MEQAPKGKAHEPAEVWVLVAAAREREKVAAAVGPKAADKGAAKVSGQDKDEARGKNKIAKYPFKKGEKRCQVAMEWALLEWAQ